MLITVYSSKHHLILIWIFFLNYVRSFLKNRMQHLAEAAPVNRTQNHNFKTLIENILIDDSGNISILKRKKKQSNWKSTCTCNYPSNWLDKKRFKSNLNNSGEKKIIVKEYIVQDVPPSFICLRNIVNQSWAFRKYILFRKSVIHFFHLNYPWGINFKNKVKEVTWIVEIQILITNSKKYQR